MDYNLYEISTKVKLLRREQGISQKELATKCKLSHSAISTLERGSRLPTLETVIKVASYFSISIDDLVSYSGENKIDYNKLHEKTVNENLIDLSPLSKSEISAIKLLVNNLIINK